MFESARSGAVPSRPLITSVLRLDDDDPDEVRRTLLRLRSEFPKTVAIHVLLGKVYCTDYFERRVPDAIQAAVREFASAVQIAPKHELASMCLALSLWLSGAKEAAIVEIGRFLDVGEPTEYWETVEEILRLERLGPHGLVIWTS